MRTRCCALVNVEAGKRRRRISWDEALTRVAEKAMETREKYGAEALFCTTGGGGNPEIWSIARFCNVFGTPNWYEAGLRAVLSAACAVLCHDVWWCGFQYRGFQCTGTV